MDMGQGWPMIWCLLGLVMNMWRFIIVLCSRLYMFGIKIKKEKKTSGHINSYTPKDQKELANLNCFRFSNQVTIHLMVWFSQSQSYIHMEALNVYIYKPDGKKMENLLVHLHRIHVCLLILKCVLRLGTYTAASFWFSAWQFLALLEGWDQIENKLIFQLAQKHKWHWWHG